MTLDDVKMIGVAGAGQMGTGIALAAIVAGWKVCLFDVRPEAFQAAQKKIQEGLGLAVEKGALPAGQADETLARIYRAGRLEDLAEAQCIIEAAPEDQTLKAEIFRRLGQVCMPDAVLASNTSSISITRLAGAAGHPERVVGIHFMNPVPAMRLVEVVRGQQTAEPTVTLALALAKRMGKTPVQCKDTPGFIVNRILIPMINEAIYALEAGVAAAEAIDLAMTEGANHPVGPLALADRIGLDTVLAICEILHKDLNDPRFRPAPLLRQYVQAGRLGRKTGRGFFTYRHESRV